MKTAEDFKNAAIKKQLHEWRIHDCSLCAYPCGYIFSNNFENVLYDSGCDCVNYKNYWSRTWEDVAEHYNMQTHPDAISTYNKFWGFEEEEK